MSSNTRTPPTPHKSTARERRALIACIRCRHLKKKCKPECGALSLSGRCRRCRLVGEICQYLTVADEISSRVPSPPPTGLCTHGEEHESTNNDFSVPVAPPLQWHHASIETNDTGPQSFASGSLTHPTEDVRDIHSDVISYQSNRVDPADRSLSPSYASRSATESAQCDQRPPFPTATFSMSGIYAQRPDSSDMPAMMTYAPYNIPNQEANTSDRHSPHGGWDPYASSDRQAFSPRNYHLRCLICSTINCKTHPECVC